MACHYKHLVIVHGIGDQKPNETALGFMNEFLRQLPQGTGCELGVHNLIEGVDLVKNKLRPVFIEYQCGANTFVIGFSEVYWQNVTDGFLAAHKNGPPIPVFPWAHSIGTRLQSQRGVRLWREAVTNIERILGLTRYLARLLKKHMEFDEVTVNFLGDVQMYAESDELRQQINQRFFDVMARIATFSDLARNRLKIPKFDSRQTYVIGHSEGTVVSFNALVQAVVLARSPEALSDPEFEGLETVAVQARSWLPELAGFVTFGSPIDKHYTFWKNRFCNDWMSRFNMPDPEIRVPWHNFFDYNDPVSASIAVVNPPNPPQSTAQPTDAQRIFSITDWGFGRYPIPGLAHIGYWKDPEIHKVIIHTVMNLAPVTPAPSVRSRWWAFLQPILDPVVYILVRAFTFLALLAIVERLTSPVPEWLRVWAGPRNLSYLAWAVSGAFFLVGIKALGHLSHQLARWKHSAAAMVRFVRDLVIAATMVVVGSASLRVRPLADKPVAELKDWIGFAFALVITGLIWSLHTHVHRGLVQMWRYSAGEDRWNDKVANALGITKLLNG
jgi:hypothetical protein